MLPKSSFSYRTNISNAFAILVIGVDCKTRQIIKYPGHKEGKHYFKIIIYCPCMHTFVFLISIMICISLLQDEYETKDVYFLTALATD